MPIYLYWGEDRFTIGQTVNALQQKILDPAWASFNFDKITPDHPNAIIHALNQALTPPFGSGQRLVWLVDTPLVQRCADDLLAELERTLPIVPDTTVLLLTSSTKPDGRLKSTKLLQKTATIQEFSPISPWKTDLLIQQARQAAQIVGVRLTPEAVVWVADAIGNQTQQLYTELEKLRLLAGDRAQPLTVTDIAPLITASTQNALQLVAAIRQGQTSQALALTQELLRQNEPALRIVATLTGQFRLRLWIKVMADAGERNERTIAQAAELHNPKQLYFLQKELGAISVHQLQQTLPLLLDLEFQLKRHSGDELAILQTKMVELCHLFRPEGAII